MTNQTDIQRYLDDWLGNAPMAPADRVVVAVAVRIRRQKQRPAPILRWALADFRVSTRALGGVAATLLVAALAVIAVRPGSFPFGAASPPPASAPVVAPTPTPDPSTTPVPTASEPPSIDAALSGGLPAGWIVTAAGLLFFRTDTDPAMGIDLLLNRQVSAESCAYGPEPGVGSSAAAIVQAIAERSGITASNVSPVLLSGLRGRQVDVTLDTSIGPTCRPEPPGFVPLFGAEGGTGWEFVGVTVGERIRIIVLDAPGGQNIVINIAAPDAATFDRHIDDAMTIVDNLSFSIGE